MHRGWILLGAADGSARRCCCWRPRHRCHAQGGARRSAAKATTVKFNRCAGAVARCRADPSRSRRAPASAARAGAWTGRACGWIAAAAACFRSGDRGGRWQRQRPAWRATAAWLAPGPGLESPNPPAMRQQPASATRCARSTSAGNGSVRLVQADSDSRCTRGLQLGLEPRRRLGRSRLPRPVRGRSPPVDAHPASGGAAQALAAMRGGKIPGLFHLFQPPRRPGVSSACARITAASSTSR